MEKKNINQEIIQQMAQLLDRTAVESFAPVITNTDSVAENLDAMLISLRSFNAGYDKSEAISQIRALMDKYNIQIDELMELYQVHS